MIDEKKEKPLLIIDGYGFIFRAYHVQPPLTAPSGLAVGALYGFTSMLMRLISDFRPEYAVVVLDHGGKNFRHDLYQDYKANRPTPPDDLIEQLKIVKKTSEALNFTTLSYPNFEADDVIATIAQKAENIKKNVVIISGDKDFMQLSNDYIKIYDPTKSKYITDEDIVKKFGVTPDKVREVQALMGDKSDNIPGVTGFGPKTAAALVNQFGSLEGIINSIDEISSKRQRELLTTYKDDALVSWELVGLNSNVELKHNLEKDFSEFSWLAPDSSKISNFLNEYGFKSLKKRAENLFNVNIDLNENNISSADNKEQKKGNIIEIDNIEKFNQLSQEIRNTGHLSVILSNETTETFVLCAKKNVYLLTYKENHSIQTDLFAINKPESVKNDFTTEINQIFEDSSIKKITYNIKDILRVCNKITLKSFDDLQIMLYICNAGNKERILLETINHYNATEFEKTTSINKLISYFYDSYQFIRNELIKNKALHLYQDIDLPLSYVLHDMESNGIKIDTNHLSKLSEEFGKKISKLEKEIFKKADFEFNIASPKQLGEVLFEKMGLPFGKASGKTKSYSTNASILEKLEDEGHDIARLILDYRHFSKLKSTYTDALTKQINKNTNRLHTTFLQTVTSTGRLSSINPNVQNIPVRTSEGNEIRAAFVSKPGYKLISADYSQIELRILSQVANIKTLKDAFDKGHDIHAQTASQIFGIPIESVTSEIRRNAKAINFGIIYGISGFGLAKQLNISKKEAAEYIEKYFQEYPGIKEYMSHTVEFAKENGFVENLLKRKTYVPLINDKNHALRSFAERAAINAPMQSLASDIIKLAMLKLHNKFLKYSMKTKMLLQIHDELVFECPNDEVEKSMEIIKSTMENAFSLGVKTKIDILSGENWKKIH